MQDASTMNFVVGSGPAGVACTAALLRQRLPVTMVDAGALLEPQYRAHAERLQATPPALWDVASLAAIKRAMKDSGEDVPLKTLFGSAFAYRAHADVSPVEMRGAEVGWSFARGGLSNVWGAAVLPYRADDIGDWPIGVDALAPHYRAVLSMIDFAAEADELDDFLPLYADASGALPRSRQAAALLSDLRRNAQHLRGRGVRFGASRLAVRMRTAAGDNTCIACGLCMFGCPYQLIYNSTATIESFLPDPLFRYSGGSMVEQVGEQGDAVTLLVRDLTTNSLHTLAGNRVYLASGVLSTTRILLQSLDAYDRSLTLLDSAYFLLPLLRFRGTPGVFDEPLHTLSQVFLEIADPAVSARTVHMQIYTFNEMYLDQAERSLGPLGRWLPWPKEQVLGRLLVMQGFLHSEDSQPIRLCLRREARPPHTLVLSAAGDGRAVRQTVGRIVDHLWELRSSLRAVPIRPMLKMPEPGRSFHTGGTFPMQASAEPFECDMLGRPAGFARVHVVDASCFPSIPATTITLTVMANAHRIASAHSQR
jgi:choline dehydrogenase-like flavoprotein